MIKLLINISILSLLLSCETPQKKEIEEVLNKTKKIRELIDKKNLKTEIEIDGGINFDNSKLAIEAGVNILVSGTTIFKQNEGDLKKNIQLLRTG